MIEYLIIKYDLNRLEEAGKKGWQLCSIYDGKMFFSRPIKKQSKNIVTISETEKFFDILGTKEGLEEFSNNNKLDQQELFSFYLYWTEKGETSNKMRWQKEKVFDIKRRLYTWFKNKKFNTNNKIGII